MLIEFPRIGSDVLLCVYLEASEIWLLYSPAASRLSFMMEGGKQERTRASMQGFPNGPALMRKG